jgi:hypothetical protein
MIASYPNDRPFPSVLILGLGLADTVRRNTSIDWTARESIRAKLRIMAKRILRKYAYLLDKQQKATQTVIDQAGDARSPVSLLPSS